MLKEIDLSEAVETRLAHDITEIRPGEFKGPAFRKGHKVRPADICHLQRLGKNHLYVLALDPDEIHENQAAAMLAESLAGEGIRWDPDPTEGKIGLQASIDELLTVNVDALAAINMVEEMMCATFHRHTLVKSGELVAATRAIPLVMKRSAGAEGVAYGAAVLPGAMILIATIGNVPLIGVPACALHHCTTVLDLVLPRILAGEKIGSKELAMFGHGGLCRDCPECSHPHCPFGKGI